MREQTNDNERHVIDPLAKKFYRWSPYHYTYCEPLKHIDPDGKDIIVANKNQQKEFLLLINTISKTQYTFDSKGKMMVDKKAADNKSGSAKYSAALNFAIGDSKTIALNKSNTFIDKNGNSVSVDGVAGGGVTQYKVRTPGMLEVDQKKKLEGGLVITISGNSNKNIPGEKGNTVPDTPDLILMHELYSHAIPAMKGESVNSAITKENEVRDEIYVPRRAQDINHTTTIKF